MKKALKISAFLMIVIMFASCSPKVVGTWTIANYEETTPGQKGMSFQNIGTITFNNDGTGEKDISYSIMGMDMSDKSPFNWKQHDNILVIDGDESELAKTWIMIESKRKSQSWKSTDGASEIHKLRLKKN
jgi:hypothetical protein